MMKHLPQLNLDEHFAHQKLHYAAQIVLATLSLAVILISSDALANAAIVTAIASSAFLVFINPGAHMAQPRRVVGGHSIALIVALVFSVAIYGWDLNGSHASTISSDAAFAAAVGVAIFLMVVTNTEHAPAAGTVLGLVIEPWSLQTALGVAFAAIVLSGAKVLLQRFLIDLL